MVKAVIFDLDDTLYDYRSANQTAQESLLQYSCTSLKVDKGIFQKAFLQAREEIKEPLQGTAAEHNRLLYCQRTLELLGVNAVKYALEMYNAYWDAFLDSINPFEGAIPLLKILKENKFKIGICTDLTAHIQHRKLKKLGLVSFIDVLVTSEEAGVEKPNARIFQMTLNKLGVMPQEAFVVGDSSKRDIAGATALGIPCFLFHAPQNPVASLLQYQKIQKVLIAKGDKK